MTEKKLEERVATGRRKRAVASVRLREGNGKIDINGRELENYFPLEIQRRLILAPFEKVGGNKNHNLVIRVKGGGIEAQAVAVRLGISRSLSMDNDELQKHFKDLGYLTRDPRRKERKKYGLAGARKRFQFSKR